MRSYLITGASRGIGLAITEQLLKQKGTFVIATARNFNGSPGLKKLTSNHSDSRLAFVPLDVSKQGSIDNAVKETTAILGSKGLDNLILNAGTNHQPKASFDNMDFEMLADELKFNVEYPIRTIRSFLPLIRAGQDKRLAIMTSLLGSVERAGQLVDLASAYSISKAALNMTGRKYAGVLQSEGIRTIMLHPGWVKTDIGDGIDEWMAKYSPDSKQISTAESAAGCVKMIQSLKSNEASILVEANGNPMPW